MDLLIFSLLNFCIFGMEKLEMEWPNGKSVRIWSCRLGFDPELGQTNDNKIGIRSFPA